MTIPIEIFNYNTLPNVVKHFYRQTKKPLSEVEEICLDAVLSTGLTRKQGTSRLMRDALCPADTLRWIVGTQCSDFRRGYTTRSNDWRSLVQWHNDPNYTVGARSRDGDYQSGVLITLIAAHHLEPSRSPLHGLPAHMFIPVEYQHICYGLVRCTLQQQAQNTNDLLRLLSGHLPEPCPIPVPIISVPVDTGFLGAV